MTSRRQVEYPRIDQDGRLSFPEPVIDSARHFGAAIVAVVKKHAEANFPEYDAWDTEGYVYLNGAKALLRVVVGKDGASRENARDAKGAVDGVSIKGIIEDRPGVILIVSGGNGGSAGGAGGRVEAKMIGLGGVLIGIGGNAGFKIVTDQAETDGVDNGADGGDSLMESEACQASQVFAAGGDGASAPPALFDGGNGGNGGVGSAYCFVIDRGAKACEARARGGNGGHGASGINSFFFPGIGGSGGRGRIALAKSCCGERGEGHASAIAGSGGHGGNGGNSLGNGANAGRGALGLEAHATVFPGVSSSTAVARAVAGSGGNGGNGGNGIDKGGAGGEKGEGSSAFAINYCGGPEKKQNGVDGHKGKNGKP